MSTYSQKSIDLVELKLDQGYMISVFHYSTWKTGRRVFLICCYKGDKMEKSILITEVSRRDAVFVRSRCTRERGYIATSLRTPAIDLVFRRGEMPHWVTYRYYRPSLNKR